MGNYINFNLSEDNYIPLTKNRVFPSHKGEKSHFYGKNYHPIEWSMEKGAALFMILNKVPLPYRFHLPDINPEEDFVIHRFLLALDGYEEQVRIKTIPTKEVLRRCCIEGPAFAKFLKKYRMHAFLTNIEGQFLTDDSEFVRDNSIEYIFDIGQVFNYQYLIFWRQDPDEESDFSWMFKELDINEEALKNFRRCAKEYLKEVKIKIIDEREFAIKKSSSKSWDKQTKKTDYHWKLRSGNCGLATSIGETKRCIIPVGPENYRDAVITQSDVSPRISLIDNQVFEIVEQDPNSMMVRSPSTFEYRLQRLKQPLSYFFMRDMKKEGLTKPRVLLTILLEELKRRFPEADAFRYPNFFEDLVVFDPKDQKLYYPKRGHGLGMANSLTTLMQLVIDKMIRRHLSNDNSIFDYDFLVLNDDHVARFDSLDDLMDYEMADTHVLKGLGIIKNKEKSLISPRGFVFCERYYSNHFGNIDSKESYKRNEILSCFLSSNIVEAKRYMSTISREDIRPYYEHYKEDILNFFGYEFYPEEINYPALFGGWFTSNLSGVRLDLYLMEQLEFKKVHIKAYEACKESSVRIKAYGKDKPYLNPVEKLLSVRISDEVCNLLGGRTINDNKSFFMRNSDNPKGFFLAWESLRKRRLRIFNSKHPDLDMISFFKKIYEEADIQLYYPPKCLITGWVGIDINEAPSRDLYLGRNPLMSAIGLENSRQFADLNENYSLLHGTSDSTYYLSSDLRRITRTLEFNFPQFISPRIFGENFITFKDWNLVYKTWYNHQRIARCAVHLSGNYAVPIIGIDCNRRVKDRKKEVYGRLLSQDEETLLSNLDITDRRIIKSFILFIDSEERDDDTNLFELYEQFEKDLTESEEILITEYTIPILSATLMEGLEPIIKEEVPRFSFPTEGATDFKSRALQNKLNRFFNRFCNLLKDPHRFRAKTIKKIITLSCMIFSTHGFLPSVSTADFSKIVHKYLCDVLDYPSLLDHYEMNRLQNSLAVKNSYSRANRHIVKA